MNQPVEQPTVEQASKFLIEMLHVAQKRGAFEMQESASILSAINILNAPQNQPQEKKEEPQKEEKT